MLMVNYYDTRPPTSGVHRKRSVRRQHYDFKRHFLPNRQADFDKTSWKCFFHKALPKMFKKFDYKTNTGCYENLKITDGPLLQLLLLCVLDKKLASP